VYIEFDKKLQCFTIPAANIMWCKYMCVCVCEHYI